MMILDGVARIFENIGTKVLEDFLNVPTLSRIMNALDTGGLSELNMLEGQLISKARPAPLPYQDLMRKLERSALNAINGGQEKSGKRRRVGVRSRQAHQRWLNDNRWRFDWRSQPRVPAGTDAGGEWMEGRLDYQVARKSLVSRSQMRRRVRAMKEYKKRQNAAGNLHTRTIRSAWGDY